MKAAAVVVRWRGGDEVDRCLKSLRDHGGPELERTILVDSGSGDGGAERLARSFPEVEVVSLAVNRSFAHAANRGAEAVEADAVLFLNPDAEVTPGAVSELVSTLDRRPDAAAAAPLLVGPDGRCQHRWQLRRLPTVARLAVGRPGAPAVGSPPNNEIPIDQPAAAAWLIRREAWQALGGFDERFAPAWWEDVDLCARLAALVERGGVVWRSGFVVAPRARFFHIGGSSVAALTAHAFLTAYSQNLLRFARVHHPEHLAVIRHGLTWTLRLRAVIHPGRARAYLEAASRLSSPDVC